MPDEKALKLSDQVRRAIRASGLSRYRIAKEAGLSESNLAQFYHGRRGLSMDAFDSIGKVLDLRITLGRRAIGNKE